MLRGSPLYRLLMHTNRSAVKLWRYVLLRFHTLYKALHPPADPSNLPLCPPRRLLLGYPPVDLLQHGLLRHIILRRHI